MTPPEAAASPTPPDSGSPPDGERLQKALARKGFGSRRTCEELIVAERVTVNGQVAGVGRRIDATRDRVQVDGVEVSLAEGLVYYLLYKPAGVISTSADTHGRRTVVDLVPAVPRVFSVGRLDADTEGLIILTNDGALSQLLAHPRHGVEKEYVATVDGNPSPAALRRLRQGVELDDGRTAPARVSALAPSVLRIVVHEGRNRQVRRMCEAVGHPVTHLVRTRIGPLADRSLSPGRYRELSDAELRKLREAAATARSAGASRSASPRPAPRAPGDGPGTVRRR